MDLCGDILDNVKSIDNVPDGTATKMYGEDSSGNLVKDDVPSGGASAFTELSDVPQSYTDQAGKMLIVNDNENALEFTDLSNVISNSHAHTNKTLLDSITDEGAGNEFLSDDGTYKAAGLAYFEESRSVAAPNATVPAHQIIPKGEETNIDVVISPKGTGAILAQVPDGTATGGNKRGENAVDFQKYRMLNTQVASGNYSATLGGRTNKASGLYATIAGGGANTASGESSAIAGGTGNTASGKYSSIPGGYTCTASKLNSFASGDHIMASGIASSGLGSYNYATGDYSSIPGGVNAYAKFRGQYAAASGYFTTVGDAQRSNYVLRGNVLTTNYYRLYLDNASALIDLSQAGAYSTWQCKLMVSGLRRLTGAIDHYVSEHNFMIYRENGTPVIADYTEIHTHQVAASSVATGVSITTNSLAIDIATTENNWQFVAHLETVETYSDSLV